MTRVAVAQIMIADIPSYPRSFGCRLRQPQDVTRIQVPSPFPAAEHRIVVFGIAAKSQDPAEDARAQ